MSRTTDQFVNLPAEHWPQVGAIVSGEQTVFRVWAPLARSVAVQFEGDAERVELCPLSCGYFEGVVPRPLEDGFRYRFCLDGERVLPDPASRWQPDGVFGPSAVLRPDLFQWTDEGWRGVELDDLVIYELHVGTFTPEGSLDAAIDRLPELKEFGITAVELMPVAQFTGNRGWGYDGVFWFAVQNTYGGPHALQRFVNAAHNVGLAVILDVVYNHFGPEGNWTGFYGPYSSDRYRTPWGDAINFDGPHSDPVRSFVLQNALHWIVDFHIDGLRIDAIHAIYDASPRHILEEIATAVKRRASQLGRNVLVISESNLNDIRVLDAPEKRGYGHDAQWSDDFHHCVHTLLTGERDGYYEDFGTLEHLVKCLNQNFVYDGIYSVFRKRRHGAPSGEHAANRFICSIQTHDQVGNRALGERLSVLVSPEAYRCAVALLLLSPFTPLLFMGEEYAEQQPFPFFCDYQDPGLQEAVRRGRREEFKTFRWPERVPDPLDPDTYYSAKLTWDWNDGVRAGVRRLYADLLRARREWPPMRETRDRHACLITSPGTSDRLLRLVRGDRLPGPGTLVAYFNLNPRPVPLTDRAIRGQKLLLRTEDRRYTGRPDTEFAGESLAPLEVRAYGSPAWWTPANS